MISEITSVVALPLATAALGDAGSGLGADGASVVVPPHAVSSAAASAPVSSDRQRVGNRMVVPG
ncbi:MAG: hypothetical protein IT355_01155 [Gemmatimonadaceae bacterium]|nr:hypothetical protein [Gemmatimonadaceae bacterium]